MFGLGKSYKSVVDGIAEQALAFDLMKAPGLDQPRPDVGGYLYNALEGVAAILFLSQRSLLVVNDKNNFEKARDRLASSFFLALEQEYSKPEMRSLVLPLLEQRHLQYERLLDGPGEPGARMFQLGHTILRNVVDEDLDPELVARAFTWIAEKLMLEPGRRLKELDGAGKIRW